MMDAAVADPGAEPVVASIRKNGRGEELSITLSEYRGARLLTVRVWFRATNGDIRPSRDGFCVRVDLLPAIVEAMQRAGAPAEQSDWLE